MVRPASRASRPSTIPTSRGSTGGDYIVVRSYVTGNPEMGYSLAYGSDLKRFPTLRQAIRYGTHDLDLADDFLIGVVDDKTLMSLLWMDELRDDRDELSDVAYQLCLAVPDA